MALKATVSVGVLLVTVRNLVGRLTSTKCSANKATGGSFNSRSGSVHSDICAKQTSQHTYDRMYRGRSL